MPITLNGPIYAAEDVANIIEWGQCSTKRLCQLHWMSPDMHAKDVIDVIERT
jgi:hypothetical protein